MRHAVAALFVALLPGLAFAQPTASSFQVVDAKVEKDKLFWTETRTEVAMQEVAVTVNVNGMLVTEKRLVPVMRPVTITRAEELKGLKATDAAGKAIPANKLAEALKETAPVVVVAGPIAEKHRALFKDKVIFLELPQPKNPPPGR
jgi:hypothetical protein